MVHFAIFIRDSRIERLELYFVWMINFKALSVHSSLSVYQLSFDLYFMVEWFR